MSGLLQIRLCFSVLESQRANKEKSVILCIFQQQRHGEVVESREGRGLINSMGGQDGNPAIAPHCSS